jgi:hypothetical protein
MNEQINKLINEAGTDVSGKWMSIDNVEQFAELIICKCAEKCVFQIDREEILKHFGKHV